MKKEGSKPFKTLVPYVQSVHDSFGDVVIGSLWNALYILAYVVFVTVLFLYIYKNQYQTLGHLIIVSAFVVAEFGFLAVDCHPETIAPLSETIAYTPRN